VTALGSLALPERILGTLEARTVAVAFYRCSGCGKYFGTVAGEGDCPVGCQALVAPLARQVVTFETVAGFNRLLRGLELSASVLSWHEREDVKQALLLAAESVNPGQRARFEALRVKLSEEDS
jgi:hypothetical protein